MASIFSYRCASCREIHEGSPGFSFGAPDYYFMASEATSHLTNDTGPLSGTTSHVIRKLLKSIR